MNSADYSDDYDPDADFDVNYSRATARVVAERLRTGDRVLDLGCATGLFAYEFSKAGIQVEYVGVDRSSKYLAIAESRAIAGAAFVKSEIEPLPNLKGRFDHVLLLNVLHEVNDPASLLRSVRPLLRPHGRVHISLQNPRSLHRLIAFDNGIIRDIAEISFRGNRFQTKRMLYQEQLTALVRDCGFVINSEHGVFLKPLTNDALGKLDSEMLDGLERVAWRFPQNCAMNYVCATV